jgi:hypothetical protein
VTYLVRTVREFAFRHAINLACNDKHWAERLKLLKVTLGKPILRPALQQCLSFNICLRMKEEESAAVRQRRQ